MVTSWLMILGRLLNRDEALARPERDQFFQMADHIVTEDQSIRDHLDSEKPTQQAL